MSSTEHSDEQSSESTTSSDGPKKKLKANIVKLAGLGAALAAVACSRQSPVPNPQCPFKDMTGRQWVEANLHNERMCFDNFRMCPHSFMKLHNELVQYHGLGSSQDMESYESLAMFLWVCATKQATRQITLRLGRGMGIVSQKMGEVADAMYSFAQTVVAVKDPEYRKIHPRFDEFRPYFDGCIGALDGTRIKVQVSHKSRVDFMNRKGDVTMNVLGIVDMDGLFTYVGAGSAGSSHDMSVLTYYMGRPDYPHPPAGNIALSLTTLSICKSTFVSNG